MIIVACPCGKIRKGTGWIWIDDSFSTFMQVLIEKITIRNALNGEDSSQKINSLSVLIGECKDCQKDKKHKQVLPS